MNPIVQPPAPQPNQPQEVHLSDYINVIMRRRRTFLVAFCAVFIGVALYTFAMRPIYEATATLYVKDDKAKSGVLGELSLLASNNPIDAEIEILKSRTIAEQVVRRLHLDWRVEDAAPELSHKVLEFATTAKRPSCTVTLTGPDSYTVKDADGKAVGSGKSGVLFQSPRLTLLVQVKGKEGDSFQLSQLNFNGTVAGLRSGIKATEVGKKTNIIRIAYSNTDPALARDIVNTLVQSYLDQSIAFKTEEASRTVNFVEEQLTGIKDELGKAESDLQQYKSSAGVVQLDTEAQALINKFSDVEKERAGISIQKKQLEFALASLKESMSRGRTYSPAVLKDDPLVAGMASRLAELEVQKRALLEDYTKDHPAVKTVQGQIDELLRKIQATYETGLKNLTRQESDVTRRLAGYEGTLRQLPAAERDLARYMRLAKVNADIYTFLLQKHEEARIAKASTISNINIVDPAIAPDLPIKPQKKKNLLLGLLVGCMLGVGLAFFQEYLDDTIKEAEEAKRILGFAHLGTIPHIGKVDAESTGTEAIVSHTDPRSSVAEAFRSLRTGIHFSAINRDKRVLVITSSFPGEGKSTVSANLAITIAQTGTRVLLIDCDMRRSSLHDKLRVEKIPGLSEVLAKDTPFAAAVHTTEIPNLHLLAAGTTPPNPSELLGSVAMRDLLDALREEYDQIVIDAPPVLAVTDAPVLTTLADMVLVVLETGRIPAKAAIRMRELLGAVQAPVAGLVINDKTGRGMAYGGYYGYKYGYGYGYGYYGDDEKAPAKAKPWWRRFF
ncbi:polysaccharide biosynthesis tyrosine autokinase [Geobacter sp. AOG1]|uniref:GumC family protein n=1 Tax=Geobacter sp. AOG1 TaxID=1566346 RepID=UPI001CC6B100|nr:polysaccharide biosynthesis tyrosine autokinase [Geobacter sp. AOG1]GFE58651.1 tyrosine protein kinase [Geobacter sp. AOG1]